MNAVEQLVKDRLVKLKLDNEYLVRQIQISAQRLEDLKSTLSDNIKKAGEFNAFLATETVGKDGNYQYFPNTEAKPERPFTTGEAYGGPK